MTQEYFDCIKQNQDEMYMVKKYLKDQNPEVYEQFLMKKQGLDKFARQGCRSDPNYSILLELSGAKQYNTTI